MGFDTRSLPAYFNTDADLQAWVAGVRASLQAAGLVRTSDTGQIDAATVTRSNSDRGYDIFRFDDTQQATFPIFIKLMYSPAVITRPGMKVTVGTGTNGAGTLTGQVSRELASNPGLEKSVGVTLPIFSSKTDHGVRLIISLDSGNAGFGCGFMIERLRGLDGSTSTDGVALLNEDVNLTMRASVFNRTGSSPAHATKWPGLEMDGQQRAWGTDAAVMPFFFVQGKVYTIEPLLYVHADFAELVPVAINHLGVSQNYMPLGDGFGDSAQLTQQGSGGYAVMLPWVA